MKRIIGWSIVFFAAATLLVLSGCPGLLPSGDKETGPKVFADYATKIPDANLRAEIESAIGKKFGEITEDDLGALTGLYPGDKEIPPSIATLTGLEYCTGLQELNVWGCGISDISPLKSLTGLKNAFLGDNKITDITPLLSLPGLNVIYVPGNPINPQSLAEFTPANFPNLVELGFDGTDEASGAHNMTVDQAIALLAPFQGLTGFGLNGFAMGDMGLQSLFNTLIAPRAATMLSVMLANDQLTDQSLQQLCQLPQIKWLHLWGNSITNVSPIAAKTTLVGFNVDGNQVTDLTPLRTLYDAGGLRGTGATVKVCWQNLNLSPGMPNRDVVDYLISKGVRVKYVTGNAVTANGGLVVANYLTEIPDPNLRRAMEDALGGKSFAAGEIRYGDLSALTWLNAFNYGVSDLTGVGLCSNLVGIDFTRNSVSDLSPLSTIGTLREIWAQENLIADLHPLLSLPNLAVLSVPGNTLSFSAASILTPSNFPHLAGIGLGGDRDGNATMALSDVVSLISHFSYLTMVKLWNFPMGDTGFTTVKSTLIDPNAATLRTLELGGCQLTNAPIAAMGTLTNLTELNFWGNSISDISALSSMVHLNIMYAGWQSLPLASLAVLQTLYDAGAFHDRFARIDVSGLGMDLRAGTADRVVVDYLISHGVNVSYQDGNTVN